MTEKPTLHVVSQQTGPYTQAYERLEQGPMPPILALIIEGVREKIKPDIEAEMFRVWGIRGAK